MTARSAYEALVRTPLPMPLMACPEPLPPDADPVPCGGPVTVTGARLGLSLQQSADGLVLVPAWLFDVEGSPQPLVQLAVDPSLLQPMAPDQGGGSGGAGSSTGSTGSAGTVSAAPGGPATDVPAEGSRFSSVTRAADDRSLTVTFYGGVPECYSYAVGPRRPTGRCGSRWWRPAPPATSRASTWRWRSPRRCRWTRRSGSDRSSTPTSGTVVLGPTR